MGPEPLSARYRYCQSEKLAAPQGYGEVRGPSGPLTFLEGCTYGAAAMVVTVVRMPGWSSGRDHLGPVGAEQFSTVGRWRVATSVAGTRTGGILNDQKRWEGAIRRETSKDGGIR